MYNKTSHYNPNISSTYDSKEDESPIFPEREFPEEDFPQIERRNFPTLPKKIFPRHPNEDEDNLGWNLEDRINK
jgi:hypothetical protein